MSNYTVRLAVPSDIPAMLELGVMIYEENKEEIAFGDLNRDNYAPFVTQVVYSNSAIVLEDEKGVFASCGLMLQPLFVGTSFVATDAWILCKKEKRGYRIFREMLNFAKNYSIINKAQLILRITSTVDTERKIKLYEKSGFKVIGATLLYVGDKS